MPLRAARATDQHVCPLTSPAPHLGGPLVPKGDTQVLVEGLAVARLADLSPCAGAGQMDLLIEGAATVLVGGLPWCSETHLSVHGGVIMGGAAEVFIGGPRFVLPANFKITGSIKFANKVIRDLFFLHSTRTGAEILRQLEGLNQPLEIQRIEGMNAYCRRLRPGPSGSVVSYNPGISVWASGAGHQRLRTAPQVVLAHELVHALNNARGANYAGTDPNPPASQPHMEESEAAAIGVGSHRHDFPSENSLRSDLSSPPRADHSVTPAGAGPTANYRPGGY